MFDVLGYRSLAEGFMSLGYANELLSLLARAPEITLSDFSSCLVNGMERFINLKELRHVVFSDTVLLVLPVPEDEPMAIRAMRWLLFLGVVWKLACNMLYAGLPLRGGIAYGDVAIHQTCFAGRPIVEAYDLSQGLDAAVCVLDEDLNRERFKLSRSLHRPKNVMDLFYGDDSVPTDMLMQEATRLCTVISWMLRHFAPRVVVPRKGREDSKKVCCVLPPLRELESLGEPLEESVELRFSYHGKILSDDAKQKARNTSRLLQSTVTRGKRFYRSQLLTDEFLLPSSHK